MSGITVGTAMLVSAGVAAGAAVYSGNKQASAQKKAMEQSKSLADKNATASEQAHNAANQKRPNTSSILDAASQSGRSGVSGTMLTGAQGVDKNAMALGRNTLLGQ